MFAIIARDIVVTATSPRSHLWEACGKLVQRARVSLARAQVCVLHPHGWQQAGTALRRRPHVTVARHITNHNASDMHP